MTLVPLNLKSAVARKANYDPFASFRDDMDRLLEGFFSSVPATKNWSEGIVDFKVNISETDKEIQVRAELPGVDEKDVEVTLNRDLLTIKGEKKAEKEEKEKNYHLIESSYGGFARSVRLPFEAAADSVSADFSKGVLTISLPKPKSANEGAKKIEVKAK